MSSSVKGGTLRVRDLQAFFPGLSATVRVPRVDGARAASPGLSQDEGTSVQDGRTGWLRVFSAPKHCPRLY